MQKYPTDFEACWSRLPTATLNNTNNAADRLQVKQFIGGTRPSCSPNGSNHNLHKPLKSPVCSGNKDWKIAASVRLKHHHRKKKCCLCFTCNFIKLPYFFYPVICVYMLLNSSAFLLTVCADLEMFDQQSLDSFVLSSVHGLPLLLETSSTIMLIWTQLYNRRVT